MKAAEREGMKAILVENVKDALSKLAGLAGLQVQTFKDILLHFLFCYIISTGQCVCVCMHVFQVADAGSGPPPCNPNNVSHGYITIRVTPHHRGYEKNSEIRLVLLRC